MSSNNTSKKTQKLVETKDLVFVWKLILKNILLLILFPIFAYAVGYIYTYRLVDVYGAKVQLLLKSSETYDYQDPIYKGLGAYGAYMDVQNQIRILQSRDLVGEIIDRVDFNTSYYFVGRIKNEEVFESLPFKCKIEVLDPSLYENPIKVKILDYNSYELRYDLNNVEKTFVYEFNKTEVNKDFKISLIRQHGFNKDNVSSIKDYNYQIVFHSHNNLISKYRSKMAIQNLEHTSILEITLLDELQPRGKMFLDTLTAVYIDFSKRVQLEVNQNTLDNIEKQIDTISEFIKEKEIELLRYKDQNAVLHLSKEENEYFEKYVEFNQIRRELVNKISSLYSLENYMLTSNDEHLIPPSFLILEEDTYLSKSIPKIYTLQLELKSKSGSYLEKNENIKKLRDEISSLKKDVLIYIDNLKKVLDADKDKIDNYIASNKASIQKIPITEQGISNIRRELDVNNKMYLFLLEKKTNTLIARAGIIPQVRVVETTTNLGVVQPDKSKIIRLFVLGGLVFALFVAVVRKLFFEKIENVNELAEITSLPVMGGLPFIKEVESKLIVKNKPKAQITESFRTLRTNLSYLGANNERKSKFVMISSFFPGEGKTFTSTNLSSLIGMSDKKIIVIDFDLHKPKIHKTFELSNDKGISTYLIGKSSIDKIINKSTETNLDIITAGPIPPNPSELILKKQVLELFEYLEGKYDYIIIDTPPFGLLNDAIELIKFIDVFLVVMNTKFLRRKGVHVIEEILDKHQNISIGLVLNGIKKSKIQYYYSKYTYKYNYNYGYNYGYGYGDSYSDYVDND